MIALLRKCEAAARHICFETIDVILTNQHANNLVEQLTGKAVDETYRKMKIVHLETYLFALEDLAEHWELIKDVKYAYR